MLAQEASGWILVPIGVTRRYYDEKGRCFRNQFVPIAYVFTKSETSTVFSFAHERLSWVLRRCLGMETIAYMLKIDCRQAANIEAFISRRFCLRQ